MIPLGRESSVLRQERESLNIADIERCGIAETIKARVQVQWESRSTGHHPLCFWGCWTQTGREALLAPCDSSFTGKGVFVFVLWD